MLTVAPVATQGLPDREQSAVLLNIIALKGAECGLLRPWETAIVRSMAEQDMLSWDEPRKARVGAETEARLVATTCDKPPSSPHGSKARDLESLRSICRFIS